MTQWWLADSLRRFYPRSPAERRETLHLAAIRGERVSGQVICSSGDAPATISVEMEGGDRIKVLIRRVGYVPLPHLNTEIPEAAIEGSEFLPGFDPDPLWPESTALVGPRETTSFWITIEAGAYATAGGHPLIVICKTADDETVSLTVWLVVHPAALPERRGFPVSHWLYAVAIADWYRVELFGEPFRTARSIPSGGKSSPRACKITRSSRPPVCAGTIRCLRRYETSRHSIGIHPGFRKPARRSSPDSFRMVVPESTRTLPTSREPHRSLAVCSQWSCTLRRSQPSTGITRSALGRPEGSS